jgi:hypothetical protein
VECESSATIANEPHQTEAEGGRLDQFADGLNHSDQAQDVYGRLEEVSTCPRLAANNCK